MSDRERRLVERYRETRTSVRPKRHTPKLSERIDQLRDLGQEAIRGWRIQRKIDARDQPLEFCLRPYLALLLYTVSVTLFARACTHWVGEPPYWSLWWDEGLMWPIAWIFCDNWGQFSSSVHVENTFYGVQNGLTAAYFVCGALLAWAPRALSQSLIQRRNDVHLHSSTTSKQSKEQKKRSQAAQNREGAQRLASPPRGARLTLWVCWITAAIQLNYALSSWAQSNYLLGVLMEQSLHVCAPIACALMLPNVSPRWEATAEGLLQLTVSLCFIGHGLFAIGWYPTPASFLTMTLNLTPFTEDGAETFLMIFGALDLVVAALILTPIYELRRLGLGYMILWGALTALARPLGSPCASWVDALTIGGPEMLWRSIHAIAPLWLWRRAYH